MTDHTLARADEVLTELVELVETARTLPMSSSCVVPRERTLDLLDALREVLPPEMIEARRLVAQRDRLLSEAAERATTTVTEAEERAAALVAEAGEQAESLLSEARRKPIRRWSRPRLSRPSWCRPRACSRRRSLRSGADQGRGGSAGRGRLGSRRAGTRSSWPATPSSTRHRPWAAWSTLCSDCWPRPRTAATRSADRRNSRRFHGPRPDQVT